MSTMTRIALMRRCCSSVEQRYLGRQQRLWNYSSVFQSQRLTFSTDADEKNEGGGFTSNFGAATTGKLPEKERLWMGPDSSLDQKMNSLLEAPPGDLHRLDVHLQANDLIIECCKRNTLIGMQQAHDILNRLLLEKRTSKSVMIAAEPFEIIMFGWAKLADSSASTKMRDVLTLMEKEYQYDLDHFDHLGGEEELSSESSCAPETSTYNTMLRGLAQVAKRDPDAAFVAEELLDEMMHNFKTKFWQTKPNTRSFTHVIQAHGNTGLFGAGDRAERILQRMRAMHDDERERYEHKFGRPYSLDDQEENVHQIVTPDVRVYSTVLSAIINSNAKDSADRASELLQELLDAGEKVDAFAFNAVIFGFGRLASKLPSPKLRFEAALKAEELALIFFEQHDDICVIDGDDEMDTEEIENYWAKQLTIAFNAVLSGWAMSDVNEAAPRAEALFQRMVESPRLKPDKISMNSTMKAWARAFNPHKAEEMLNLMNELAEAGTLEKNSKPDAVSYCTVMSAWAKSRDPDKTSQARRLLEAMMSKYDAGDVTLKPNVVAFTTVLNAAGHTTSTRADNASAAEEAYRIAMQTYEEILSDSFALNLYSDTFVFAAMLKVVASHTDHTSAERRHMVQRVFDDACAAGQVSAYVIKELRLATPDNELLARLFRDQNLAKYLPSVNRFPKKWTKGVPGQPRFRDVDEKGGGRREGSNRQRR